MSKVRTMVHTLRAKPYKTRRTILLAASFGVTALIVIIWLATFAFTHRTSTPTPKENQADSPFTIIKDSVVEVYDGGEMSPAIDTTAQ